MTLLGSWILGRKKGGGGHHGVDDDSLSFRGSQERNKHSDKKRSPIMQPTLYSVNPAAE